MELWNGGRRNGESGVWNAGIGDCIMAGKNDVATTSPW